jgi:hypothetical protein
MKVTKKKPLITTISKRLNWMHVADRGYRKFSKGETVGGSIPLGNANKIKKV